MRFHGALSSFTSRAVFSATTLLTLTMKFRPLAFVASVVVVVILLCSRESFGWGFWAHKEIHRYAIRSLPVEMKAFFEANAEEIVERSIEPDERARTDRLVEGPYHFIDIDRYGAFPFKELPRSYDEAVKKFGKATVDSNGTVPWRIADFTAKLTDAMKRKDKKDILFYVANLGHYVADVNVPLHTVENYDGQLSDQRGIHSRWESRIPEMFGRKFNLKAEAVEHIKDPLDFAFTMVLESNRMADTVLAADKKAKEGIPESELFKVTERRGRTEYQYSDRYYGRFNQFLNGMVERRMNNSIRRVASYWYTAWVNAGKINLEF